MRRQRWFGIAATVVALGMTAVFSSPAGAQTAPPVRPPITSPTGMPPDPWVTAPANLLQTNIINRLISNTTGSGYDSDGDTYHTTYEKACDEIGACLQPPPLIVGAPAYAYTPDEVIWEYKVKWSCWVNGDDTEVCQYTDDMDLVGSDSPRLRLDNEWLEDHGYQTWIGYWGPYWDEFADARADEYVAALTVVGAPAPVHFEQTWIENRGTDSSPDQLQMDEGSVSTGDYTREWSTIVGGGHNFKLNPWSVHVVFNWSDDFPSNPSGYGATCTVAAGCGGTVLAFDEYASTTNGLASTSGNIRFFIRESMEFDGIATLEVAFDPDRWNFGNSSCYVQVLGYIASKAWNQFTVNYVPGVGMTVYDSAGLFWASIPNNPCSGASNIYPDSPTVIVGGASDNPAGGVEISRIRGNAGGLTVYDRTLTNDEMLDLGSAFPQIMPSWPDSPGLPPGLPVPGSPPEVDPTPEPTPTTVAPPVITKPPHVTPDVEPEPATGNDVKTLGDRIGDFFGNLGDAISAGFSWLLDGLTGLAQWFLGQLSVFLSWIGNLLIWGFNAVREATLYVGSQVVNLGRTVTGIATWLTESLDVVLGELVSLATTAVTAIGGLAVAIGSSVASGLASAFTSVVNAVGSVVSAIAALPSTIWSAFQTGLQTLFIPTDVDTSQIGDACEGKFPCSWLTEAADTVPVIKDGITGGLAEACGPHIGFDTDAGGFHFNLPGPAGCPGTGPDQSYTANDAEAFDLFGYRTLLRAVSVVMVWGGFMVFMIRQMPWAKREDVPLEGALT